MSDDEANGPTSPSSAGNASDRKKKKPINRRRKARRGTDQPPDAEALETPDLDDEFQSDWQKYGEKQDEKRSNMEILDNAISAAVEADKIGAETLVKLESQREQLERMDEALAQTNDSLNNSERIIRGMKSLGGAIHNVFSGKKKGPDTRFKAQEGAGADGKRPAGAEGEDGEVAETFTPGQQTKVRKQGTLIKLGGFVKNWKERYFSVDATSLLYFKEMPGPGISPQGRIPLIGMKVSKFAEQEYGKKHCFGIRAGSNDRIFVLVAKNDRDRDEWIEALRAAEHEVTNSLKPLTDTESKLRARFEAQVREEDKKLDQLSDIMRGLAQQGQTMNHELVAQDAMLTHIDGQVEATGARIKQSTREIRKILKQ